MDTKKEIIREEIQGIEQWLDKNDWKINKRMLNEWSETDERWLNYLNERFDKRARRDELLLELENLRNSRINSNEAIEI